MQPIISPWLFYLIGVANVISPIFILTFICSLISFITLSICTSVNNYKIREASRNRYPENEKRHEFLNKSIDPWRKLSILFVIVTFLPTFFLPSKNTLIKMFIAQQVTYNRVNTLVKGGKNFHDIIKKDIFEIIEKLDKRENIEQKP